jgi:hypothetical protein
MKSYFLLCCAGFAVVAVAGNENKQVSGLRMLELDL